MTKKKEKCSFKCHQCGACCRWPGHVLLTDQDICRLASAMDLPEEEFIRCYTVLASNRCQLSLMEEEDGSCILLDRNRCGFYDARPEQCRAFPEGWRDTSGCPAMNETGDV